MRTLLFSMALGLSSTASADVLPPPDRPEWDYTPLPMPEPAVLALVLGVIAVAVLAWRARES